MTDRPEPSGHWPPSGLEAALAGFAPSLRPPRPDLLGGADVTYVIEDTAVGRLLLAGRADGRLVACRYVLAAGDDDRMLERLARAVSPRILRGGGVLDDARRQLAEYLAGRRRAFEVPVDLSLAGPFQQQVLTRLARSVGYGSTTSYGALARAVDRPAAARAVGAALGTNPLCVVLPCHRVVASSGSLTGYAGGLAAKRFLLDLEGMGR